MMIWKSWEQSRTILSAWSRAHMAVSAYGNCWRRDESLCEISLRHVLQCAVWLMGVCNVLRSQVKCLWCDAAYCIWSVISSFSNLNQCSSSIGLFCHVLLRRDLWDWDWRLRLNCTPNAICRLYIVKCLQCSTFSSVCDHIHSQVSVMWYIFRCL